MNVFQAFILAYRIRRQEPLIEILAYVNWETHRFWFLSTWSLHCQDTHTGSRFELKNPGMWATHKRDQATLRADREWATRPDSQAWDEAYDRAIAATERRKESKREGL
jgi:hypothetical protein